MAAHGGNNSPNRQQRVRQGVATGEFA